MISISKKVSLAILAAATIGMTANTYGDAQWVGGGGDDLWSNGANWDPAGAPASATDRDVAADDQANVARMSTDGTTTLIDSTVDAVAFGLQLGHPVAGSLGDQSASNVLNMTGGTLTTQGNFLFNIGRGRNADPNHLVQFNMSGGVVNAAGITIPEGFNPNDVLGFTSVGINAEMHVSGDSVVNTDLLRLGAADANSVLTISDNAQINLTDDNGGFAPGALWIEAFEDPVVGTSLLDIRDNATLTVHGEWWTDEDGDEMRGAATATEAQYFQDNYVANGWIVGNGGASDIDIAFANGVITITAAPVPEPGFGVLLICALPFVLGFRRKR